MPRPLVFGNGALLVLVIVKLEVRVNPDDVENGSVTVADHWRFAVEPEGKQIDIFGDVVGNG